jgi:hypothetical protein
MFFIELVHRAGVARWTSYSAGVYSLLLYIHIIAEKLKSWL